MRSILATLALCLSLTGCATCRDNPTACAIAAAGVIVGGCILAREHDRQTIIVRLPRHGGPERPGA